MQFTWHDGKKRIKWIYWVDFISYDMFEGLASDCDYLQIWYPRKADMRIGERYREILPIIEGSEYSFGDKVYSKSVSLEISEEDIFSGFKKTRRYETKRAMERDNLQVSFTFPNKRDESLNEYIAFYNAFAAEKKRVPIDEDKVLALVNSNMFAVGKVSDKWGGQLVANAYIVCEKEKMVSLYTSSSLFRSNSERAQLIGRANGYLHYMAMCLFKEKGYAKYDFGGFYTGKADPQRINISEYKNSFGGQLEEYVTGFSLRVDEVRNIEKNLINYEEDIRNKKVIIYGVASWGKYVIRRIEELYGVIPECLIDNNLCREDKNFYREDILGKYTPQNSILIITTTYENYIMICAGEFAKPYFDAGTALCIRNAE